MDVQLFDSRYRLRYFACQPVKKNRTSTIFHKRGIHAPSEHWAAIATAARNSAWQQVPAAALTAAVAARASFTQTPAAAL